MLWHVLFYQVSIQNRISPGHFQRKIYVLFGLEGAINMTDDMLVYWCNQGEHNWWLKVILKRIQQAVVTLNREKWEKCELSRNRTKLLGQVVAGMDIYPEPKIAKAIQELNQPIINITEIGCLLRMPNQFNNFLPNQAEKMKPLQDLLKKNIGY